MQPCTSKTCFNKCCALCTPLARSMVFFRNIIKNTPVATRRYPHIELMFLLYTWIVSSLWFLCLFYFLAVNVMFYLRMQQKRFLSTRYLKLIVKEKVKTQHKCLGHRLPVMKNSGHLYIQSYAGTRMFFFLFNQYACTKSYCSRCPSHRIGVIL